MKILNIGIVGGGSFGTALGTAAARSGHNVLLHSRNEVVRDEINNNHTHSKFFPNDIKLPNNLNSTCNLDEVVSNSDIIIHAIPVQASYEFLLSIADKLKENTPYIIASKGILLKQKKFFSEIWTEIFKSKNIPHCVLSGPSFAIEIMKEFPTVVSLGCKDKNVRKFVQENLSNQNFRIYTTHDVIGVEIGGALKNPLAIGAGILEGIGYKYNSVSAFITRGIIELSRFSKKFGGEFETLNGLSGIGDVMLSCMGSLSRNKTVGLKLATGISLDEILQNQKEVAEGIPTLLVLGEIIKEHNLEMPICETLFEFVTGKIDKNQALTKIMTRPLSEEI